MKFCKKCQTETDSNVYGRCKLCVAAYAKEYRVLHPEKKKASNEAWRVKNLAKRKAYNAERYSANPGKIKAQSRAWKAAHPDREKVRHAAYNAANPDAVRVNSHNRRARERLNGGVLSRGLSDKLFKLQKGKCPCCGLPLGDNYHLDHKMPLVLGGANTDDNMQLLRSTCNQQKHAKHPVDFMQSRGFLL